MYHFNYIFPVKALVTIYEKVQQKPLWWLQQIIFSNKKLIFTKTHELKFVTLQATLTFCLIWKFNYLNEY